MAAPRRAFADELLQPQPHPKVARKASISGLFAHPGLVSANPVKPNPPMVPKKSKIKHQELTAPVNPAYIDLTAFTAANAEDKIKFELATSATYIWSLVNNEGKPHLVLGVEYLKENKEAFHESTWPTLEKIEADLEKQRLAEFETNYKGDPAKRAHERATLVKDKGHGHPTTTCKFDPKKGTAHPDAGEAWMAGELSFNKANQQWEVSDKSGRLHKVQGSDTNKKLTVMNIVVAEFKRVLGITPQVILLDKLNPDQLWAKVDKKEKQWDDAEKALNALSKTFKHLAGGNYFEAGSSLLDPEKIRTEMQVPEGQALTVAVIVKYGIGCLENLSDPELREGFLRQLNYMATHRVREEEVRHSLQQRLQQVTAQPQIAKSGFGLHGMR